MDGPPNLNDASKLSNVALEDVSPRLELLAHHLQQPPALIAPSCRPEDEVVSHGYPNFELRFLSLPALTLKESSRYTSDHLDLTSLAHRLLSHPPRHLDSSPAWGGRAISTHKALCPSSVASSSALPDAWPVSNRWSSLDLLMASDHAAS